MSLRAEVTFEVSNKTLVEAVRRRIEYHRSRSKFWLLEEQRAKTDIETKGVVVKELPVTGGYQVQAQIDPTLATALQTANQKRRSHEDTEQAYQRWYKAFDHSKTKSYDLHMDDLEFFGVHKAVGDA